MAGTSRERVAGAFDRLATSYKLLILLSLSLLPIMLIALLASWQAARNAAEQHRAEYAALAIDNAAYIDGIIALDQRVLTHALAELDRGDAPAAVCARLREVTRYRRVVRPYAVYGASEQPICAGNGAAPARPAQPLIGTAAPLRIEGQTLLTVERSRRSGNVGVFLYGHDTLASLNRAVLRAPGVQGVALVRDGAEMSVAGPYARTLASTTVNAPMQNGVELRLTIAAPGASASDWLLALVPILMWVAAAIVGFLVVDRALLRPLEVLRTNIAAARGGIPELTNVHTPAHEIRDLADVLADFSRDRATHESAIGAALDEQTAATREVHHRVKNNLQVIASLISLHSRATDDPAALDAFAAIQRRVDALAIVHRNHYAHSDQQGALELKPALSELIANLLTNLPGVRVTSQLPGVRVTLDVATALTFLITEFVELATTVDREAPIAIEIVPEGATAQLKVRSAALSGEAFDARYERYARILNGLVRQLRTELIHDSGRGEFLVQFATLPAA